MTRDLDSRISRIAALGEPVRRALYRFVGAQHRPVSRDEAAEGIGVPRHVAKFHLDRLEEDGLLEAEFRRPPGRSGPGAGRPSKWYRRSPEEVTVSLPERRYELMGNVLARAVAVATTSGVPIDRALKDSAAEIGEQLGDEARQRLAEAHDSFAAVTDVLDAHGYEPMAQEDTITLANCPFHALAREYTDLVCGLNLGIIDGMLDELPGKPLEGCLDPGPDRCCVRIRPRQDA